LFEERYTFSTTTNSLIKTSSSRLAQGSQMSVNHLEQSLTETKNSSFLYAERYNSFDLVANIRFGKKFSALISNSFSDNYIYKNDSIINNISGVGDLLLIANYRLINTKIGADSLAKNKLLHRITIGAGIELPTGSFNKKSVISYETTFTPNTIIGQPLMELEPQLQAGTGSFNYLFLIQYMIKFNKFGLNNYVSYKVNSTNRNDFRFANRFNVNTSLFYLGKINKELTLMPNVGTSYEFSDHDLQGDDKVINSGGEALFINSGITFFFKNISFELTYYQPVYNYLYGNQPSNKARIISQISIYF